jgi:hypothetical protein
MTGGRGDVGSAVGGMRVLGLSISEATFSSGRRQRTLPRSTALVEDRTQGRERGPAQAAVRKDRRLRSPRPRPRSPKPLTRSYGSQAHSRRASSSPETQSWAPSRGRTCQRPRGCVASGGVIALAIVGSSGILEELRPAIAPFEASQLLEGDAISTLLTTRSGVASALPFFTQGGIDGIRNGAQGRF